LSVEAARLLAGVIRNSRQKPKGRRWNFEDKVLALALLKCSPKSYILLQTLFPLPSRRTLQSVLNTVHFTAGINAHVFGALKHSLQTMSDKDRYCILMFDEMSIRENLCFKQTLGCIEGFEDFGSQGRTSNIANHALVSVGYMALTARKMVLVSWTTYIRYSGDLMLLHLILPQVTLGKPMITLLAVFFLRSKYNRK
jgi:hypothetical protein